MRVDDIHSVAAMRAAARRRLPKVVFDFVDGGATRENTLRDNEEAFSRWQFIPRVARDTTKVDVSVQAAGSKWSMPLGIAPTGLAGLLRPDGEILLAKAAARFGVPFCLSTMSVAPMEDVARGAPDCDLWFQLYIITDREKTASLLHRAQAVGCKTLCLALDQPAHGKRWRDLENGWRLPLRKDVRTFMDFATHPSWSLSALFNPVRFGNIDNTQGSFLRSAKKAGHSFDASVTWDDVEAIRAQWKGKLILKGLLSGEDVQHAHEVGADGVIVSNHGGRQLDDVPASIDALDAIRQQAGSSPRLLMDGGVRTGTDILKAVAIGASACMVGRPTLWGLAVGGQAGAERVLEILRNEFMIAVAIAGVRTLDDAASLVRRKPAEIHSPNAPAEHHDSRGG
ncbi:alpha-hydroxy-acid oxidizing protein [Ramlibacter henchirensis]|uniref:Alpha-hydroxy-acid oxidizing protein n=1 Tax=Ramlibacter henchirensis TaxID=204072 RepID=A0A4Z0BYE5_9BURK|nr:alpha-hydroxy acid oxidase [Ramlibacter henchirensis]TFZ02949.1 alpha-hydroxy-acid oxidizing protein [Ramlibacter henchirensis]